MNAKNPSHGRFAFVVFTFLALGSVACGAPAEGGAGGGDPSQPSAATSEPPASDTADPGQGSGTSSPQPSEPGAPSLAPVAMDAGAPSLRPGRDPSGPSHLLPDHV